MSHLAFELLIFLLIAFIIGCIVGWLLRRWFGAKPELVATAAVATASVAALSVPDIEPKPEIMIEEAIAEPVALAKPEGLTAPIDGKADDLKLIWGVGPKLEGILNGLGFYHFSQIANWTRDEVHWVDDHLQFPGRIDRDDWIEQAQLLANGEFETIKERYKKK